MMDHAAFIVEEVFLELVVVDAGKKAHRALLRGRAPDEDEEEDVVEEGS